MDLLDHIAYWLSTVKKRPRDNIVLSRAEIARIERYCQLSSIFELNEPEQVNSISRLRKASYSYDWYRIFNVSDSRKCHFAFGDIQYVPDEPTFTKSRPICESNENNVLLPLNTVRHFNFYKDPYSFSSKSNIAVWRGAAYKDHRKLFLDKAENCSLCDCKDTSRYAPKTIMGRPQNHLQIREQLKHKFIFAIEGNDVASNLKWVMASNSIAVMPQPRFETWFLENQLIPNQHYIEISRTFDNIEEALEPYLSNNRLASEINQEAKAYAAQFFDLKRQFKIAAIVAEKYFALASS